MYNYIFWYALIILEFIDIQNYINKLYNYLWFYIKIKHYTYNFSKIVPLSLVFM